MELLHELSGLGLNDKVTTADTLRKNDVDLQVLLSLDKDNLTPMIQQVGTVQRILRLKERYLPTALHIAAFNNDSDKISELLQRKHLTPDLRNKLGDTAFHVAVKNGNGLAVDAFLAHKGTNIGLRCELLRGGEHGTAFHIAAEGGFVSVIQCLLRSSHRKLPQVSATTRSGKTARDIAFTNKHFACWRTLFLAEMSQASAKPTVTAKLRSRVESALRTDSVPYEQTELHRAARHDDRTLAKKIVAGKTVPINVRDEDGDTPIHVAATYNSIEVATLFLESDDIDVYAAGANDDTPLLRATNRYNVEMAALQVFHMKPDERCCNLIHYNAPLRVALETNHVELTSLLLAARNFDVNAAIEGGNTPLHVALAHRSLDVVSMLISIDDINLSSVNDDGETTLHLAARTNFVDIAELIISKKNFDINSVDMHGKTPLHIAIEFFGFDVVMLLLSIDAVDVNVPDRNGDTALHFAAGRSRYTTECMISNKHCDINARNKRGRTPLHFAVESLTVEIVALLLSKGADVNAADCNGDTALHLVAKYHEVRVAVRSDKCHAMAELLTSKNGCLINAQNNHKETPLHIAVENNSHRTVSLLLAKDSINVNAADSCDDTALHVAARYDCDEIAHLIVSEKAFDINARNTFKQTALHIAAEKNSYGTVSVLLFTHSLDLNATDYQGNTALHLAAEKDHYRIAKLIIPRTACNINAVNDRDMTPLHIAAECNSLGMVMLLLSTDGINVNAVDQEGDTALHVAAKSNDRYHVAQMIWLEATCDINARNKQHRTPHQLAVDCNSYKIASIFRATDRFDEKLALLRKQIAMRSLNSRKVVT